MVMDVMANFWPIAALLLTLISAIILLTNKPKVNDYLSFGLILIGIYASWAILHPRQTPLMEDARRVQAVIGSGTPVLLEFQSPY
jgi:hypothetical protein